MAASLVEHNVSSLKKKKKKPVKLAVENVVGISLIGATSSLLGGLD